ncbi:MAG: VWA domain-containing protein [Flavobacteriaceae bacterium]
MVTRVLSLCILFLCQLSFGQENIDDATRTAINLHTEFINECSYFVDASQQTIKKFNLILNDYAKQLEDEDVVNHKPIVLAYNQDLVDLQALTLRLAKKELALSKAREAMPEAEAKTLKNAFDNYQAVFIQIQRIVTAAIYFTENQEAFFKDFRFNRAYALLEAYEFNIRVLGHLNHEFNSVVNTLFKEEQLPRTLQQTKNIVLLIQELMVQLRDNKNTEMQDTMAAWMEQYDIKPSLEDLRALEQMGDFPYLESNQSQDRINISRHAKLMYLWAERYLAGKDVFENKKGPSREFDFIELLTDLHNSPDRGLAAKYNEYINRAETPVQKVLNEVPPFETMYPDTLLPPKEESLLLTTAGMKRLLFKNDDISTLEGALTNNLVLLLDVSISMRYDAKLDRLKHSVIHLIDLLRDEDKLTVITYSGEAVKVLETASNYNKEELKKTLMDLAPEGKSNGKAGLQMAYREAEANFVDGGNNRIIIASDGRFKIDKQLERLITEQSSKNIYLSTFHYIASEKDSNEKETLVALSTLGGGRYIEIKEENDAIKAIVSESKKPFPKKTEGETSLSKN